MDIMTLIISNVSVWPLGGTKTTTCESQKCDDREKKVKSRESGMNMNMIQMR